MNVFIFNNLNLDNGIFISDKTLKKININELSTSENTLFVVPNELLQFIEFKHDLKNNQNIHASILNSLSTLNNDADDLIVLNSSNKYNFFISNKSNQETIQRLFSHFNTRISITSDLLFFKEVIKQDCSYQNNVYLIESEEAVKLSTKSFNLLDDAMKIKSLTDLDLKKIKDTNYTIYQLNTFNLYSIFNFKNSLKPALVVLFLVFTFYVTALLNINSNYSQINKMNTTLQSIYSSIYPAENITDIYQQIDIKLNNLNNAEATDLSKTINLLKNLSESINIVEAEFSQGDLQIKCLFKNDAEESIFVNQQNRLNYAFTIVNSKVTQTGKITTFSY
ncbi:hypothetical protein OA493_01345, partial [Gammaproteobacteria bacterium]|nr:hypothetical protein [Gammaproteobacteria bacterium]